MEEEEEGREREKAVELTEARRERDGSGGN